MVSILNGKWQKVYFLRFDFVSFQIVKRKFYIQGFFQGGKRNYVLIFYVLMQVFLNGGLQVDFRVIYFYDIVCICFWYKLIIYGIVLGKYYYFFFFVLIYCWVFCFVFRV